MSAIRTLDVVLSPGEYLAQESKSAVRHEYYAGHPYAMAGGSRAHNRISSNVHFALGSHLEGKTCESFTADMKVHIREGTEDWFYYPDVMVSCDESDVHEQYCETPCLIVEVLSPDTEKIDRREKLRAYRSLPSVHTYILIDQSVREVTVYHRVSQGWEKTMLTGDAMLVVPELDFSISLDAIYARTGL